MANRGPDTNGNHFSIIMSPAPHLNHHYTVFGEVVSNLEVRALGMTPYSLQWKVVPWLICLKEAHHSTSFAWKPCLSMGKLLTRLKK